MSCMKKSFLSITGCNGKFITHINPIVSRSEVLWMSQSTSNGFFSTRSGSYIGSGLVSTSSIFEKKRAPLMACLLQNNMDHSYYTILLNADSCLIFMIRSMLEISPECPNTEIWQLLNTEKLTRDPIKIPTNTPWEFWSAKWKKGTSTKYIKV